MILVLHGVTALLLFTTCENSLPSINLTEECQVNLTMDCTLDFFQKIQYSIDEDKNISQKDVETYLTTVMNLTTHVMNDASDQSNLTSLGNALFNVNNKLASTLMSETDINSNISFSLQNIDVQVFSVRLNGTLRENPRFITSHVSLDINYLWYLWYNKEPLAVTFISYTNIFKPNLLNSAFNSKKTLMSAVVIVSVTDSWIQTNFTLKHVKEFDPNAILSCTWRTNRYGRCYLTKTNSTHSVCSCYGVSALALISHTDPCMLDLTANCAQRFLEQIWFSRDLILSQETVEIYLSTIMNLTTSVINDAPDQSNIPSLGFALFDKINDVVSTLVKNTDIYSNISFSVLNLDVQVFSVRPNVTLRENPRLTTSQASLNINFIGLLQENQGSAAVAFMSYTNMAPDRVRSAFFSSFNSTLVTAVVSYSFPKTNYYWLIKRTLVILKHTKELDPKTILSCMVWRDDNEYYYYTYCSLTQTNSTHSVCSCDYGNRVAVISHTNPCMNDSTGNCAEKFASHIYKNIPEELPLETVKSYLTTMMNLVDSDMSKYALYNYINLLFRVNELLASALVKKTDTYDSISISLQALEVQVFMVGPNAKLSDTPTLVTSHASLDIELIEISKSNDGSAAVAFMNYIIMADIIRSSFSDKLHRSNNTIMSTIVSSQFLKTANTRLTSAVNFTLKHIKELDPGGILSCLSWYWYQWDIGLCTITSTNSTHTTCTCNELETVALFMLTIPCRDKFTAQCAKNFLDQIQYHIARDVPHELVERYLNITINLITHVKDVVSEQNDLISFGNGLVKVSEQLVSLMVKKMNTHMFNISLKDLEIQVLNGPPVGLRNIYQLITSHTSLDIDYIWISNNNKGSAAVAVISYINMADIVKPIFFNTIMQTKKTMMSSVVSVSLPNTDKKELSKPINITFRHMSALESAYSLSCVYWKETEWVHDGCDIIQTNSSHTVCSCNALGMFALIMETDSFKINLTAPCITNFLTPDQHFAAQELPQETVKGYFSITNNILARVKSNTTDQNMLTCHGNAVLGINEQLVSTLVKKTNTYNTSIILQNLEIQVFIVVKPISSEITQLKTSNVFMDIDLIGISKNNKGSADLAFISYTTMKDMLKSDFFSPSTNTWKAIMSTVVSVTLPKTTIRHLTKPINIIFKHINELDPEGSLSCVQWNGTEWNEGDCDTTQINSTHTMCSCDQLATFALIMKIIPCKTLFGTIVALHCNRVLNMAVAQGVGVVFLILCLLTFAFCCQNPKETNTALINLCLNLLLFHLLNLLKPLFQTHLQPPQGCAVLNGVRWIFFVSTFVWMFIETVLLFILVKNLTKVRPNQREEISWKWLNMVGYLIPVLVVIVCALVIPENSDSEECWGNQDEDKLFDIPVVFIVALNMILYFFIIVIMIFTLKRLKNENLQRSNTNDMDLMMRVMFKSLAQFIILGCYWILLYIPSDNGVLYNVFLFLNSQQGTFIFIVHCLLNQEVRQQYRKFLCDRCCFRKPDTTTVVEETQE